MLRLFRPAAAGVILCSLFAAPSGAADGAAVRLGDLRSALPASADASSVVPAERGALGRLAADASGRLVVRSGGRSSSRFVAARVPFARFTDAAAPAARGRAFWREYGGAFGVRAPARQLALRSVTRDRLGYTHLRYQLRWRGVPVFGGQVLLHSRAGAVTAVNGDVAPQPRVSATPTFGRSAAAAKAAAGLRGKRVTGTTRPRLVVFVDQIDRPHLAWTMRVETERPFGRWRVFVDAHTGVMVRRYDELQHVENRRTFSAEHRWRLPGVLRRAQDDAATGDRALDAAHDNAGVVYRYYQSAFGRDSYDNAGHAIVSTVHFGRGYANAFWDGKRLVYGDGDDCIAPFSRSLDVVAHEFTHAVTEHTAGLVYLDEPGALNESYSDVFGALVDSDDWQIGDDIDRCQGAFRDLEVPQLYGQPATMSGYRIDEWGEAPVHTNSGIPNHAAFLLADDPTYGIGRAKTEQIYYRALTTYLTPWSGFMDNVDALTQAAADLYGPDGVEVDAVKQANAAVGLVSGERVGTSLRGVTPAADKTIAGGTAMRWSGRLVDASGRPVARRPVWLDVRLLGYELGPVFSDVTDRNGVWSMRIPADATLNLQWRVIFSGSGAYLRSETSWRRYLVRPRIGAVLDQPRRSGVYQITRGERFRLGGGATPNMYGLGVTVRGQYRYGHRRWRTIGTARVNRSGRFALPAELNQTGAVSFRWVYDGGRQKPWLSAVSPIIRGRVG